MTCKINITRLNVVGNPMFVHFGVRTFLFDSKFVTFIRVFLSLFKFCDVFLGRSKMSTARGDLSVYVFCEEERIGHPLRIHRPAAHQ